MNKQAKTGQKFELPLMRNSKNDRESLLNYMLLVPLMFFDWAEHLISRLEPEKG